MPTRLEASALQDPDVRFGFDNYEVLKGVDSLIRQMLACSGKTREKLWRASSPHGSSGSTAEAERGDATMRL
jgi:hypothetical protein